MNAPGQNQPAELLSVEKFPVPRFKATVFDDIAFTDTRDYLIKGILPSRGFVLAYGKKKCGKSFWALDASIHVAAGWEYRGRRVQQAAVVYVAAEGGFGFGRRVEGFRRQYGGHGCPFYLITVRPSLIADQRQLVADIRDQLAGIRPGLVVLDTLNRTLDGSEGRDEDMAAFIKAAGMIEDTFQCCVLVVHHSGLEEGRPRGHTSLSAAADVQIAVTRDTAENVIATVELAKDSEAGASIVSRLDRVEIGIDPDGDPITTCVVVPVDPADVPKPSPSNRGLNPRQRLGLKALVNVIAQSGKPLPRQIELPAATLGVQEREWREEMYRDGTLSRDAANPSSDFGRVREALLERELIGQRDGWVWIVR